MNSRNASTACHTAIAGIPSASGTRALATRSSSVSSGKTTTSATQSRRSNKSSANWKGVECGCHAHRRGMNEAISFRSTAAASTKANARPEKACSSAPRVPPLERPNHVDDVQARDARLQSRVPAAAPAPPAPSCTTRESGAPASRRVKLSPEAPPVRVAANARALGGTQSYSPAGMFRAALRQLREARQHRFFARMRDVEAREAVAFSCVDERWKRRGAARNGVDVQELIAARPPVAPRPHARASPAFATADAGADEA